MKKCRIILLILVVVLAAMVGTPGARAGDIHGPAVAGLFISNTAPLLDFYGLTQFVGASTNGVISTNSTDTTTGFSQILSGNYLGQGLNVTYTGDSTAFPSGPLTWSSTGSYGTEAWASSGDATFTFPTTSTFQIDYSSSLTIGMHTMSIDITISGGNAGGWLSYTGVAGTVMIDRGIPVPAPRPTILEPLCPLPGDPDEHDVETNGRTTILGPTEIVSVTPTPGEPTLIIDMGTFQVVPEPSSLLLASFGVLGLFVLASCRRNRVGVGHAPREAHA